MMKYMQKTKPKKLTIRESFHIKNNFYKINSSIFMSKVIDTKTPSSLCTLILEQLP